jgi:hypothetical protein
VKGVFPIVAFHHKATVTPRQATMLRLWIDAAATWILEIMNLRLLGQVFRSSVFKSSV